MIESVIIDWIMRIGNSLRVMNGLEPLSIEQAKEVYKEFRVRILKGEGE